MSTLCAGCGHDSITAAITRALWEAVDAQPHMIAKLSGIGCSSKTPDLFRERRARLQLRARPHAAHRHRRQRRQSRADLHRHLRRRRFAFHRPRPHVPRHSPQCPDGVRDREQRRLRAHQGPVLGVGRRRLEEQARRAQPHGAHRFGDAGLEPRRHLHRAQFFRRQGTAGSDLESRRCRIAASP